jgi:hypothetical protein
MRSMTAADPEQRWRVMPVMIGMPLGLVGLVLGSTIWDAPELWFPCFVGGMLIGLGIYLVHTRRQRGNDGE